MRVKEFIDVVTYFKTKMTKRMNGKDNALFAFFRIMRLIGRGKSFNKKFPNNIINHCIWITITTKDVLNVKKLIMKVDVRRADIKCSKNKNTNEVNLVLIRI